MRNHLRHATAAAIVGLACIAGPTGAHQQWLAPSFSFQSGEGAWLTFDHTFGDQRFRPSSGPGSYYSWWIVGPDGLKSNVPHLFLGKTRTVGEVELTEPGTYRLEAVEDNMAWTRIKVGGEEKWQPGTRADFEGFEVVSSRTYFIKAVAYVTLEKASPAAVAATGDPLEILFDDHPAELSADRMLRVRVLGSGKPLADQEVQLFSEATEGHDASGSCSTDEDGRCELSIAEPGRFLLQTSTEGSYPDGSPTDGFSHRLTVMIELKAAAATTE
ncbi:MAG: DUF4198 domain-containing protein [Pseudomonadota bacterium]